MDLPKPSEWKPGEATKSLMKDLEDIAYQVNEIRPLTGPVLKTVQQQLLGERVFSSNAIEGNTLTLRETVLILQTGAILDKKRKREAIEALNLGRAYQEVEQLLSIEGAPWDEDRFLHIHKVLMSSINERMAGSYRGQDVMVRGARHQPPDPRHVKDLMLSFFQYLEQGTLEASDVPRKLIIATWAHWSIARIHPFEDGNGRMARLWQDLLLLRGRLTSSIIRPEDRSGYYEALSAADEGDCDPLVQLICRRVHGTLQVYLNAQEEADGLREWATELVGSVSASEMERRRLEYERWRHTVERVRDAFDRCATLVSASGDQSVQVSMKPLDLIDQTVWESLRAGDHARKTWFFRLVFRRRDSVVWYIFYFGPHEWRPADVEAGLSSSLVGLQISEQSTGMERAINLDDLEDSPLSLRELVVQDNRVIRRRFDVSVQEGFVYDVDIPPLRVAKEFIEEVLSTWRA